MLVSRSRRPWALACAVFALSWTSSALAANKTWIGGGANGNWSNTANWMGGVAPVTGDGLIFTGTLQTTTNNDIAGLTLVLINFASTAVSFTLGGNAITLGGTITGNGASGTHTINLNMAIPADVTINLAGRPMVVSGVISGVGGITKTGGGQALTLAGLNTYAGATLINGGNVIVTNAAGLGAASAGTTVAVGTQLELAASLTVAEPLTLNGDGFGLGALQLNSSGTTTLTGAITLASDTTIRTAPATAILTLSGVVGGSGGLIKGGAGTGQLVLPNANTYTGATTVSQGVVTIKNAAALGTVAAGTTVSATGGQLQVDGALTVAEPLTLNGTGISNFGALDVITGPAVWSGAVTVSTADATVGVSSGQTLALPGVISGSGGLTKSDLGTLTLSGSAPNTYSGTTRVLTGLLQLQKTGAAVAAPGAVSVGDGIGGLNADELRLNVANQIADGSAVTVASSGRLNLNGFSDTIGPLTVNSGNVTTGAGTLTLGGDVTMGGTGTITGNLALPATRTFSAQNGVVDGAISGAGGLTKDGNGSLDLLGTTANTYAGPTTVTTGMLRLGKTAGVTAVAGSLTIGDSVQLLAGNQIANASAVSINVNGVFDLSGFSETVGQIIMTGGTITTGAGTLTLNGDVTGLPAASTAFVGGNLSLGGVDRAFSIGDGAPADDMNVSANISGSASAGIIKTGAGTLALGGSNTYPGATQVLSGILNANGGGAFSLSPGGLGTTVSAGATLRFTAGGGTPSDEPITLNGGGVPGFGALDNLTGFTTLSGPLTVATSSTVSVEMNNLTLSGVVGGPGSLTFLGPNSVFVSGASSNTFSGGAIVNAGSLLLNKSGSAVALPGPVTIGDGSGGANADQVVEIAGNQIANGASVTVGTSGLLDLSNASDTIGNLLLTAGNVTTGTGTLTLAGDVTSSAAASPSTISGILALASGAHAFSVAEGTSAIDLDVPAQVNGAGSLAKFGAGTLRLSGSSGYSGTTAVNVGTLLVNGAQPASAVAVSGGILGGTGTAGAVTATGGAVSPGTSPGVLSSGSLSLNPASTFTVELNGPTAGTEYDQLAVTGLVSLGSSALGTSVGFVPAMGQTFAIVTNDAAEAITGTFNGLAEGGTFAVGTTAFQITYAGGTNANDVVLTNVPCTAPSATTPPDQTVCPGATAMLTTAATGIGPPMYQWRKAMVPLTDGGTISGATGPTLTIMSAAMGDQGSYDCVVTGGCAPPFTTGVATLTISDPTAPAVTAPAAATVAQTLCN